MSEEVNTETNAEPEDNQSVLDKAQDYLLSGELGLPAHVASANLPRNTADPSEEASEGQEGDSEESEATVPDEPKEDSEQGNPEDGTPSTIEAPSFTQKDIDAALAASSEEHKEFGQKVFNERVGEVRDSFVSQMAGDLKKDLWGTLDKMGISIDDGIEASKKNGPPDKVANLEEKIAKMETNTKEKEEKLREDSHRKEINNILTGYADYVEANQEKYPFLSDKTRPEVANSIFEAFREHYHIHKERADLDEVCKMLENGSEEKARSYAKLLAKKNGTTQVKTKEPGKQKNTGTVLTNKLQTSASASEGLETLTEAERLDMGMEYLRRNR